MANIRINDRNFGSAQYRRLSPVQCEKLHNASLAILERTGVSVQEQEARQLLLDAGAYPDQGDRVRIPAWLIKQALSTAPERVVLYSRDGLPAMPMEADNVFFGRPGAISADGAISTSETIRPTTLNTRGTRNTPLRHRTCPSL